MTKKETKDLILWMTGYEGLKIEPRFIRQKGSEQFITMNDSISEKEKRMFFSVEDILRIFKETKQ